MTAIFISHRSSDDVEARVIKDWLAGQGHEQLFLDFDPADGIPAGVDWEQRLYQELRRCQALLIVLTPAWLQSAWCRNELAIAREKGKAVFVVRVKPCADGPVIPALQEVDLTADREAGLAKLARGLKEHGLDPAEAFDWKPGRPIYPGLAAFDVDDAAIFFGRSEESWQVVETLRRMRLQAVGSPRLLLLTGASGSGKSSLMRAGVLARLRKEPASWIVTRPFRRGSDGLAALADAVAWAFPRDRRPADLEAITERLAGDGGPGGLLSLARTLRLTLDRPEATLVLALDQAEELLAADQAGDAARLLDLFRTTLARVGNEILVLATIRSDRLGAWQQHPSVKAAPEHGELAFEMLPLGPMPMARIGEIVRGPASYEGLQVEDELVQAIRADTNTPDALPLLAYTLQYLHRRFAGDGRLTLAGYRSFGGLEGSIRNQAGAAVQIDGMSAEDVQALKEAFVPGLVRATAEGGFSRGRARLATLPPRAEPYLRRLIDEARLLLTDRDPQGEVTIEVAHEALLRVWPVLARWIAEDGQALRRLEALQRAAADWVQNDRREDFLIHQNDRLADAEVLVAEPRFGARLAEADRDYLGQCRIRQNRREADARETQERELRAAQELAARRRTQLLVACVAIVAVLILAEVARRQWREASNATLVAEAQTQKARDAADAASQQLARANTARATGLWNDLDFAEEGSLTPAERKALWTLARDDGAIREPFVAQLLTDADRMQRFAHRPEAVGRALGIGWPPPSQASAALSSLLELLHQRTHHGPDGEALARTVPMLASRLADRQARDTLYAVLQTSRRISFRQAQALAPAARALAEKLTVDEAETALSGALEAVNHRPRPALQVLGPMIAALRARLTLEQAQKMLEPPLAALTPEALGLQFEALGAVEVIPTLLDTQPALLDTQHVQAKLQKIFDSISLYQPPRISDTERSERIEKLVPAALALAGHVTAEGASIVCDLALDAMAGPRRSNVRLALPTLHVLANRLTREQARAILLPRLEAIKTKANEAAPIHALAPLVQAAATRLSAEEAEVILGSMVDATKDVDDPELRQALASVARTLADRLTVEQARRAFATLLGMVQTENLLDAHLASVMQAVAGRIPTEQARDGMIPLLTAFATETESDKVAWMVRTLPLPLTDEQGQAVLAPVLAALTDETSSRRLQALAQTVQALGIPLSDSQEQAALTSILNVLTRTRGAVDVEPLARALKALAIPLTAEQKQAVLSAPVLSELGYGMGRPLEMRLEMMATLRPLTVEQEQATREQVREALSVTTSAREFQLVLELAQAAMAEPPVEPAKAQTGLAWAPTSDEAVTWARVLVTLLPRDEHERAMASIAEVLKYPTSAGSATDELLDGLRAIDSRAPGRADGIAANLAWLAEAYPAIDLSKRPACPPPLPHQSDVSCPAGDS